MYSSDLIQSDGNAVSAISLIKSRVSSHIKVSLESGLKKEDVSKQLTDLATNALIPVTINHWCFDKLDEIYSPKKAPGPSMSPSPSSDPGSCAAVPPLFSDDTVYHAALCCLLAKSSKDERCDILSKFGYKFDSLSADDNVLIAQDKDIVYVVLHDPFISRK